jgi:hypothetical protein
MSLRTKSSPTGVTKEFSYVVVDELDVFHELRFLSVGFTADVAEHVSGIMNPLVRSKAR